MTTFPQSRSGRPLFIVCEDGGEYLERFERFLGADFEFMSAPNFSTLVAKLAQHEPVTGVLLDLDFRRSDRASLVDEHGRSIAQAGKESLTQYIVNQGLFILAGLRELGIATPILLFADIDDVQQHAYIKRTFAPVELVPSHVGLKEIRERLVELTGDDDD